MQEFKDQILIAHWQLNNSCNFILTSALLLSHFCMLKLSPPLPLFVVVWQICWYMCNQLLV